MKVRVSTDKNGVGFFGVVQIVLIMLKLFGLINWRWIYVLLPCLTGIALFAVTLLIVFGVRTWQAIRRY